MTDVLDQEISGEPQTVRLGGSSYPLAYKLHAIIVYKNLTGDSLFDSASWHKIDPNEDPWRFRACLYAGLHQRQADRSWKPVLTLDELDDLVGLNNAREITIAIVKAAAQDLPKPREEGTETKNELAPAAVIPTPAPNTSASSGPEPVSVSALAATSS